MRKGYGPTGVSYPYPFSKFLENVRAGKVIVHYEATGEETILRMDLSEIYAKMFYNQIDCSVYEKGRQIHVVAG